MQETRGSTLGHERNITTGAVSSTVTINFTNPYLPQEEESTIAFHVSVK